MKSATRQRKRLASAALRGAAYVALAVKLLIPVGYMPAALADGSPIKICGFVPDAKPGSGFIDTGHHGHEGRGGHAGHGPPGHAHGSGVADLIEPPAQDTGTHDHDTSTDEHQWERCSLGGLASHAALAVDWRFVAARPAPLLVVPTPALLPGRQAIVPFRSRAPPSAHS